MANLKTNRLTVFFLLSISSGLGEPIKNSAFDTKVTLHNYGRPVIINNELKLFRDGSLIPTKPDREYCNWSKVDLSLHSIYTLGNGKILLAGDTVTRFNVIDFKNCSSYLTSLITDGKRHTEYNPNIIDIFSVPSNIRLASLVTYNDSFDVFDWGQQTCMPCRYNDKGERLQVENLLEREDDKQHNGYSLEFLKDAFGVEKGYIYVFKYSNGTTALRILNSRFEVMKQRLFTDEIEAHSSTHKSLTFCYKRNDCQPQKVCENVECHLLDANLNSIAEVKLHKIEKEHTVSMRVQNLAAGGAMVAIELKYGHYERKHVFVQRIHPDGHVDVPIIVVDDVDKYYNKMYDITLNNGDYCLIIRKFYRRYFHTVIQCLTPYVITK